MLTYVQQEKVAANLNNKYELPTWGYPVIVPRDIPIDLDFNNINPDQELRIIYCAAEVHHAKWNVN